MITICLQQAQPPSLALLRLKSHLVSSRHCSLALALSFFWPSSNRGSSYTTSCNYILATSTRQSAKSTHQSIASELTGRCRKNKNASPCKRLTSEAIQQTEMCRVHHAVVEECCIVTRYLKNHRPSKNRIRVVQMYSYRVHLHVAAQVKVPCQTSFGDGCNPTQVRKESSELNKTAPQAIGALENT